MSMIRSMVSICAIACALFSTGAAGQQPASAAHEFRVILLGTGSPTPAMRRFGPAILVQAGKETLLIDCATSGTWNAATGIAIFLRGDST